MRATCLRALRDVINSHIEVLRSFENNAERLLTSKSKMVRNYAQGMSDVLNTEDDYLVYLVGIINDDIDELEKDDEPKDEDMNE